MVDFRRLGLPQQYTSIRDEHLACEGGGPFDISHMGRVGGRGTGALAYLQNLFDERPRLARRWSRIYSLMCNDVGGVIDDLVVYRETDDRFIVS